jgi:hypothetical protein
VVLLVSFTVAVVWLGMREIFSMFPEALVKVPMRTGPPGRAGAGVALAEAALPICAVGTPIAPAAANAPARSRALPVKTIARRRDLIVNPLMKCVWSKNVTFD